MVIHKELSHFLETMRVAHSQLIKLSIHQWYLQISLRLRVKISVNVIELKEIINSPYCISHMEHGKVLVLIL